MVNQLGLGGIVTTITQQQQELLILPRGVITRLHLTNIGIQEITGIDFGYGINTGTMISSNNTINCNKNNFLLQQLLQL